MSRVPVVLALAFAVWPCLALLARGGEGDSAPSKSGCRKSPRTLLAWTTSCEKKEKEDEDHEDEEGPIDTDRPDFTEATTTVGLGRVQFEGGYTFLRDTSGGVRTNGHSYPEGLLRIGVFAEWFELRIGQNFGNVRTTIARDVSILGIDEIAAQDGAEDLYLGVKLALTEQATFLPQSVLVIQSTVPTGSPGLSAEQMLPGLNYLFTWELIEDGLSISGSIRADRAVDEVGHFYVSVGQTLEAKFKWTDRWGSFLEWIAFYPCGAVDSGVGAEHYLHKGVTFLINDNLQLDAHAAVGLNDHAADFFAGAGVSMRF